MTQPTIKGQTPRPLVAFAATTGGWPDLGVTIWSVFTEPGLLSASLPFHSEIRYSESHSGSSDNFGADPQFGRGVLVLNTTFSLGCCHLRSLYQRLGELSFNDDSVCPKYVEQSLTSTASPDLETRPCLELIYVKLLPLRQESRDSYLRNSDDTCVQHRVLLFRTKQVQRFR